MSFSFVERKILFNIPDYQRTAYLILKNKIKNINLNREPYKSYHLKTVLLELTTQSCEGIENAYLFTKSLIKRLSEAYKNVLLPNFFNPSQNLLESQIVKNPYIVIELKYLINEQPNWFYFDSPVTVLGKVLIKNYGEVRYVDLPILDSEGNTIPPGSIPFMLLTELYHDFLLNLKAFSDKWNAMEKITTKVIQIKRIVRLLQLQRRNDPDDTVDDNNLFEEILQLPVEVLQMLYINLPRFPETRKEYDEWSSETPNEDSSKRRMSTSKQISSKSCFISLESHCGETIG